MVYVAHELLQSVSEDDMARVVSHAECVAERKSLLLRLHLQQKLENLRKAAAYTHNSPRSSVNTEFWVKNLSDRHLNSIEISVLEKGFQFAVTPRTIPVEDIISNIEVGIAHMGEVAKSVIRNDECGILHRPPQTSSQFESG